MPAVASRRVAPNRRLARIAGLVVIPAALLGTAVLVTGSSYSVFSATTSNPSNSFSTGTVALSDDDTGTAMFTATGLASGSTGSRCIAVTSTGSLPSSVKLYASGYTTNSLGSNLTIVITQGTGGTYASCTGFTALATGSAVFNGTLDAFATTKTSFGTGVPASNFWQPTGSGSETRVFKVDYTVGSGAAQGSSASVGFTWEAQSS